MKKYLLFFIALIFAACSAGDQETLAHITQRRIEGTGKVMISYQFRAGNELISDSMEVAKAIVVPHDSVKVVYPAGNPSDSRLVLP